jgi:hypothetical protein
MRGFNLIANISKRSFVRKLLVLAALTGTVLFGWLAGHILRYSIPALWHPPIQEMNPQIKNGYEFEFEGERLILTPQENPWVRVYIGGAQVEPQERCAGYTYYTSLPAKCRSVDGELVMVGESPWEIILVP